ncbi:MAG: hypothetical protein ACLFQK_04880 [Fibrobacterota bacterium]
MKKSKNSISGIDTDRQLSLFAEDEVPDSISNEIEKLDAEIDEMMKKGDYAGARNIINRKKALLEAFRKEKLDDKKNYMNKIRENNSGRGKEDI